MPPKNVAPPNAVKLFHCKICDKGYPRQTEYDNHLRSYDHNHRQRLSDMKQITANNDRDNARSGKRALDEMRSIPVEGQTAALGRGFRKVGLETGTGGSGFKKVGQVTGGSGFKKVGVAVEGSSSGFKKVGVTTISPASSEFNKIEKAAAAEGSGSGNGSDSVAVTKSGIESTQPPAASAEPVESPASLENSSSEEDTEVMVQRDVNATDTVETEMKEGGDVVMAGAGEAEEEVTWEEYDFLKPTGCDHATCPGCKNISIVDDSRSS